MLKIVPVKPIPEPTFGSLDEINIRFGLLSLEAKENHLNDGNIYEFLRFYMVAISVCRDRIPDKTIGEFYSTLDDMLYAARCASLQFDQAFRSKVFDLVQLYFKTCAKYAVKDAEIIKHAQEVNSLLGMDDMPIYQGYQPATRR